MTFTPEQIEAAARALLENSVVSGGWIGEPDFVKAAWCKYARAALEAADRVRGEQAEADRRGKPMSDAEILAIVNAAPALETAEAEWLHVARAIERHHGIAAMQSERKP